MAQSRDVMTIIKAFNNLQKAFQKVLKLSTFSSLTTSLRSFRPTIVYLYSFFDLFLLPFTIRLELYSETVLVVNSYGLFMYKKGQSVYYLQCFIRNLSNL